MNTKMLTQVSGILMIGVFLINLYIGLADTNLSTLAPLHYDLNWVIAAVSIVAAGFLLWKPTKFIWVALSGIAWPIVYVVSLAVDVYGKMCLGEPTTACEPSKTAAFYYLVANEGNISISGSYGWKLAPVIPIAIALLFIVFVISIIGARAIMRESAQKKAEVPPPGAPSKPGVSSKPGASGTTGSSPSKGSSGRASSAQ